MKFPYSIFDFKEIITQKYFYGARTLFRTLEDTGNSLLFIRLPRLHNKLVAKVLEIMDN
jgi:hypothetical protein